MLALLHHKRRWTFKLYDKDGSGEIDPDEMEDIFKKLCKIAAGIESDQNKIKEKVSRMCLFRFFLNVLHSSCFFRKRKRNN